MKRSQKFSPYLSALIIYVAVSANIATSSFAAAPDTNNDDSKVKKAAKIVKTKTTPAPKAISNKKITTTKKVVKPAVKTTAATKVEPKKEAVKEVVKPPKPPETAASTSNIPLNAVAIWEENARQKCQSWGTKFSNNGFTEVPRSADAEVALEKIFAAGNNAYMSGDFNGDGKKDYIIITPDGGCKSGGNNSYGKNGPPHQFLLSNDKGYSIVSGFNAWSGPQQIKHSGNNDIIEINDTYDGKCGSVAKTSWGWDGEKITIIDRRNPKGELVNQEGCLVLPQASVNALQMGNHAAKAVFPPITPGFYVYSVTCANAIAESRRDRPSKYIGLFNDKSWGYFYDDGIAWNNIRLENMDLISENQYRLSLHYLNNGNNANLTEANMKIMGADKFSITLKNYTTTYTLCPAASVPQWLKDMF